MSIYSPSFTVEAEPFYALVVNGVPLPWEDMQRVVFVRVTREVRKKAVIEVEFQDASMQYGDKLPITWKDRVSISFGYRSKFRTMGPFDVVDVIEDFGMKGLRATIKAESGGRLNTRSRVRVIRSGSIKRVFAAYAADHGLGYEEIGLEGVDFALDDEHVLVQSGKSDAQFLSRLADSFGLYFYSENGTLYLSAPGAERPGTQNELEFDSADASINSVKIKRKERGHGYRHHSGTGKGATSPIVSTPPDTKKGEEVAEEALPGSKKHVYIDDATGRIRRQTSLEDGPTSVSEDMSYAQSSDNWTTKIANLAASAVSKDATAAGDSSATKGFTSFVREKLSSVVDKVGLPKDLLTGKEIDKMLANANNGFLLKGGEFSFGEGAPDSKLADFWEMMRASRRRASTMTGVSTTDIELKLGYPNFDLQTVVKVTGLGTRHSGRYRVLRIVDDFTADRYVTTLGVVPGGAAMAKKKVSKTVRENAEANMSSSGPQEEGLQQTVAELSTETKKVVQLTNKTGRVSYKTVKVGGQ